MIRIREPEEPGGILTTNNAERKYKKYGASRSTIRGWVERGEVEVAKRENGAVWLVERSLRQRIQRHTAHRDNAGRKVRGRTIPERMASTASSVATARASGRTLPERMAAVAWLDEAPATRADANGAPMLDTKEWLEKFYAYQARAMGGSIRESTKASYDWTFYGRGRFVDTFPVLPLDPPPTPDRTVRPQARRTVLEYIHNLAKYVQVEGKGWRPMGTLSPAAKIIAKKNIASFYNWLGREYGYLVPDFKHSDLPPANAEKQFFTQDELRALLAAARDRDEWTIILVSAQTALRRGELCSIDSDDQRRTASSNPPCNCCGPRRGKGVAMINEGANGAGWLHIYGKPTRANADGKRILYLPVEAHQALAAHLRLHGRMTWRGRQLDVTRLAYLIREIARKAGCHTFGKNTHAFRRAYEAEFQRNGGSGEYMDEILGHRKVSMSALYFNAAKAEILEQANKFAPRRFLQKELPQQPTRPLPGLERREGDKRSAA